MINQTYQSPRWTNEILDCSMPMTFDTYSKCSYGCLYCFAYFQKSHVLKGYKGADGVRSVNPDKVKELFLKALENDREGVTGIRQQFFPYIQARRIMQWGGLADQFDEFERKHGVTLELLKFFDEIDYPLSFSTKATWWTQDERYMSLFAKHAHNWHVKVSIITNDESKARKMEAGVPSPAERIAAIKRLTALGIHVTLRLRPYIIGLSEDWPELMRKAKAAGADSVTTEFFCMESRADSNLKKRYAAMSALCGFDVHKFYMENSKQSGYKRLNRAVKAPIIYEMRKTAHELGMRFHVSDAFCRECNDSCNCCGVPPEWNASQTGHFGNAILIAREKGQVAFSDIEEDTRIYFPFKWVDACYLNTGTNGARAVRMRQSMTDFIRDKWNNPKSATGIVKGYGGILQPVGKDENGDIIYGYAGRKEE